MNHENVEGGEVFDTRSDVDVGTVAGHSDPSSGSEDVTSDSRLKPGVPVEDIVGLTEERARELGLLKSDSDYAAERAATLAEAEAFNHSQALDNHTGELVMAVNEALAVVQRLGDITNKSYGKFMVLGMEREAQYMQNVQGNVHFNALIELLQEAKARAILLSVEFGAL